MRIMMMPRMPPVITTQGFCDIATPTRIESMANTRSVSSTFTTVAQSGGRPSQGFAGVKARRDSASPPEKKWR